MTRDVHALPRPEGQGGAATPPDLPQLTYAEQARTLAARVTQGALCTLAAELDGAPYGSFVTCAMGPAQGADHPPEPILLLSNLAEHARNLRNDARCSLLLVEATGGTGGAQRGEPLARGRVTLVGRARLVQEVHRDEVAAAFLGAHPSAARYAGGGDFHWWSLDVTSVRYIGGFGRMGWLDAAQWRQARPDPLAAFADGILSHMNGDHADLLHTLAGRLLPQLAPAQAGMTAVDRYGFDPVVTASEAPSNVQPLGVPFEQVCATPDEVRRALIAVAERLRGG
jgi:hypothetical protein